MSTTAPDLARCCLTCHATAAADGGSLKACGGCMKARYCSTACQKADRKDHKVWCQFINNNGGRIPTPSSFFEEGDAFLRAAQVALNSAAVDALCLGTEQPLHVTHFFVLSLEPNSMWKFGDPIISKFKLMAGAAQTKAYIAQNLRWAGYAEPDSMVRRWSSVSPGGGQQLTARGEDFDPVGRFLLFKTATRLDSEWRIRNGIMGVSVRRTDGGNYLHRSLESTEGWLERLEAELAGDG